MARNRSHANAPQRTRKIKGLPKDLDAWWKEFGPDSSSNWDFTAVPDAEIIACCIWEYARESRTIQLRSNLHWCNVRQIWHRTEYEQNPSLKAEHDAEAQILLAQAEREGFDDDAFFESFWKTDFPLLEIYDAITRLIRDGTMPWQRLSREIRVRLTQSVNESGVIQPLSVASVGELEELWNANSTELLKVRGENRSGNDDTEDALMWDSTNAVQPFAEDDGALSDRLAVAFTVDFSRFTDREITRAFSTWLSENRPKRWKRPRRIFAGARQKGRKLVEYRVAVERLGLMRLLHWHSPAEVRQELPTAWRMIRHKQRYFRREVRESAKFFRKIFPFLPNDERPQSEERHGLWLPPMLRICAEVEREMYGPGAGNR